MITMIGYIDKIGAVVCEIVSIDSDLYEVDDGWDEEDLDGFCG